MASAPGVLADLPGDQGQVNSWAFAMVVAAIVLPDWWADGTWSTLIFRLMRREPLHPHRLAELCRPRQR